MSAEDAVEDVADCCVSGPVMLCAIAEHNRSHRRISREVVDLGEHAESNVVAARDPTDFHRFSPGNYTHQCRLAATIAADNADAFVFGDTERHVIEYGTFSVRLRNVLNVDEIPGCHRGQLCYRSMERLHACRSRHCVRS